MAMKIPIDTQQLSVYILREVEGMRRDKKHCDFLVKVGSEEIPVHRNILSASSDYFDAMFSHPTTENKSGVVEMMSVDPECAIICIDHMYGKEVSILPEKYEPLMYVASLLLLHILRDAIITLIGENLDPKSFFMAMKIANMYGCKELEKKCNQYAENNFGLIVEEKEFGELDQSFIKMMIKSKNENISDEMKLDAVLSWIKYDSERSNILAKMLEFIELPNVSVERRRYLLEHEPLFAKSLDLFRLLSFSIMDAVKVRSTSAPADESTEGIVLFDKVSGHLQCWEPRKNVWKQMQKMDDSMGRNYFSAVTLKEYIYVLMENKSVHRLQHSDENATWEQMADMIDEHGKFPPAVVFAGDIYVLGGYDGPPTKSIEKYQETLNSWSKLEDKPIASKFTSLLSSGAYIYNFGGCVDGKFTDRVWRFEPTASTWSQVAPMKALRGCMGVVELDSNIYVLGGSLPGLSWLFIPRLQTTERYDPVTDTWTTLKPLTCFRSYVRGFAINGNIYAAGDVFGLQDTVEKYDVDENEWRSVEIPSQMKLKILEAVQIKMK